jgi:hypothetical protein
MMVMLGTRSTKEHAKKNPYKSMLMATEFACFISSWLSIDVNALSKCLQNSILFFSTVTIPFTINARKTEGNRESTETGWDEWLAIDDDVQ